MGYIERSLADGERLVYRTRLHPVIFVWPPLLLLVAYLTVRSGFEALGVLVQMTALIGGFLAVSTYLRSEYAVTSRRIFGKFAWGRVPEYPEIQLIEVNAVEFKRGLLAVFFDYGTVVLIDRQGVAHEFSGVPKEFYRQAQARDERIRRVLR